MKQTMKLGAFLLLCFSAFAQTPPAAAPAGKSALDKATLEAYLRHVELWVPQVTVKIDDPKPSPYLNGFSEVMVHLSYNGGALDQTYLVSKDGKSIVKGDVYDVIKNPFQANLDKLKTDQQPSFGAAGAPVTLVVFGDFQCPVCKEEAKVLRENLTAAYTDKVRVIFKDFPLESIHPWARAGSIAARCVFRQNPQAFWKYHDWIYDNQEKINGENLNSQVLDWAGKNGVDSVQLGRCIEGKATDAEIAKNIADGRSLGVDAIPTLFINGRKLVGAVQWNVLQQLIQIETEHQAKASAADEQCCVVNIPKVGK